jgi:hypothetical protein
LNIPSTDPYFIDHAEAEHSAGNSNFNLRSTLKNSELRGLATATKITKAASRFDKKFGMKFVAKIDHIEIFGDYTMNGKVRTCKHAVNILIY